MLRLSPGDVQGVGRRMTILLVKTMILVVGCGLAASLGAAAWIVAGRSLATFAVTTAGVLTLETAALLPVMASAFRRFDPSLDTPL